jgi:hypothetical protein
MAIKNIIVCGDSWATPDRNCPGKHFSEILNNEYGYDVTALSRGGMSTVGICFQLKTAFDMRPDAIILCTTSPDRIAFAVKELDTSTPVSLKDIVYANNTKSATCGSPHVGNADSAIISDTSCFFTVNRNRPPEKYKNLSAQQMEAIKQYYAYLHNDHLQKEIDSWVLGYWTNQFKNEKIPVIRFWDCAGMLETFQENSQGVRPFLAQLKTVDWCFHTNFPTQRELAQVFNQELIKTLGN